jgi:hypothetical protein
MKIKTFALFLFMAILIVLTFIVASRAGAQGEPPNPPDDAIYMFPFVRSIEIVDNNDTLLIGVDTDTIYDNGNDWYFRLTYFEDDSIGTWVEEPIPPANYRLISWAQYYANMPCHDIWTWSPPMYYDHPWQGLGYFSQADASRIIQEYAAVMRQSHIGDEQPLCDANLHYVVLPVVY